MTLEEAKEFYFEYYGFSFHMDREEPVRYGSFMMLHPGDDVLGKWDGELLDGLLADLWSDPARIWVSHERIFRIIGRHKCDTGKYLHRILDEMAKMEDLDLFNMTLIIENMAGRTESMKDGGVCILCRYPTLAGRMNDVMERLIAACSANHETDDRFEEAVCRYRSAYRKWGGKAGREGR